LPRECAEDLDGALQERFEVAAAHRAPLALRQRAARREPVHAPVRIVVDELELQVVAQDAGHAAVAKQRGQVVSVRTHSEILIVDQIKLVFMNMNILAMKIAMT